jgi:hypothetical protein
MRCERGDEPVCQERDGEGDNATESGDSEPFLVYHPGIQFGITKNRVVRLTLRTGRGSRTVSRASSR